MQSEIMPGNNINNIKYIYIFTCKLHRHRDRDRDRDRREAHTQKLTWQIEPLECRKFICSIKIISKYIILTIFYHAISF